MTSKYAPKLGVPDGFDHVLRDFVREVLRSQPSNIYQFGANYFEDRIAERSKPPPTPKEEFLSRNDLEEVLKEAFARADTEYNGYLHHRRFADVLRDEVRLQINERQLQKLMAEASENDYGMIEYRAVPFIALAAEMIDELHKRRPLPDILATAPVDVLLSRGMLERDFTRILEESFLIADEHESGMLSRAELRRALATSPIGLSTREVNILMYAAVEDKDNMVRIGEYLPQCFDLIRHYDTDNLAVANTSVKAWRQQLLDVFVSFDEEQSGSLHVIEMRNLLFTSDLGLSHLQIYDLLADCDADGHGDDSGFVDYRELSERMAQVLYAQGSIENSVNHAKYIRQYADIDVGESEIASALTAAFDVEERFTRNQVFEILSADTALRLTRREIQGLMATLDEDTEGTAIVEPLLMAGPDVIRFMAFQVSRRAGNWSEPPFRTTVLKRQESTRSEVLSPTGSDGQDSDGGARAAVAAEAEVGGNTSRSGESEEMDDDLAEIMNTPLPGFEADA